jgi:hypothetical protein
MATEEFEIKMTRAKPKEHRVHGILHFKYSGRLKEVQSPNEPTFWKTVDRHLKDMGFMGPYPRDEEDKKLYTQMREHPERKFDLRSWGGDAATGDTNPVVPPVNTAPQPPAPAPVAAPKAPEEALQAFAENVAEDKPAEEVKTEIAPAPETPAAPAEGEIEVPPTPDELKMLSQNELQALCHKYDLSALGNKSQLRSRIETYFKKKVAGK